MKQTLGYEDKIEDVIKSYRFTVISMAVLITVISMMFAFVLFYIVNIKLPEAVQTAMADYFEEYEVIK